MRWMLDLIFPKTCVVCKKVGSYICRSCSLNISFLQNQACPNCRKKNRTGLFCGISCSTNYEFDQLIVCMNYTRNLELRKMIFSLKYGFNEELAKILAGIMIETLGHFSLGKLLAVPVPLSKARKKFRGFNQASLLAKFISKSSFGLEFRDVLQRRRSQSNQAKLNRKERLENLQKLFYISKVKAESLSGNSVLLVDDVASTGSTLNECSKVLKNCGVVNVIAIVLARSDFRIKKDLSF